jgi:hypothetical protein
MTHSVAGTKVLDVLRTPWKAEDGISYCDPVVLLNTGECIQLDGEKDYYWKSLRDFCGTERSVAPYELLPNEMPCLGMTVADIVSSVEWAFFAVGVVLENQKVIYWSDLGSWKVGALVDDVEKWRSSLVSLSG